MDPDGYSGADLSSRFGGRRNRTKKNRQETMGEKINSEARTKNRSFQAGGEGRGAISGSVGLWFLILVVDAARQFFFSQIRNSAPLLLPLFVADWLPAPRRV